MGLLDSLLQGGQDRDDHQDFVNRYDQGPTMRASPTTRRPGCAKPAASSCRTKLAQLMTSLHQQPGPPSGRCAEPACELAR
jgi:hypothetical protein